MEVKIYAVGRMLFLKTSDGGVIIIARLVLAEPSQLVGGGVGQNNASRQSLQYILGYYKQQC